MASHPPFEPPSTAVETVTLGIERAQVLSESYNRTAQIHRQLGDRWTASVRLPPLDMAAVADWQGFFDGLQGQVETFWWPYSDTVAVRGSAAGVTTGTVSGAGQAGSVLATTGWAANVPALFLRGDVIQISDKMRRIAADAASDGAGSATLELSHALLTPPANGAAIITVNPRGVFRLSRPDVSIAYQAGGFARISFDMTEVLP